jgi:cation diffusion facilitator family transporter
MKSDNALKNMTDHNEKSKAALNSVVAAVFITLLKIVIGVSTNSLGILSEAAHSGLDLVAAAITFFSVRLSDTPPDVRHPYGHGKIENLSALIETVLLVVTCIWIVYEVIIRLFVRTEAVEASIWSFVVMSISIVVDVTRSRMLLKMAKKHNSQALEADALHFSTDVWSSCVVILGLLAVYCSGYFAPGSLWHRWLINADAVAALLVAAIVVHVSMKMGKKAVDALLDGIPAGMTSDIRTSIASLHGVSRLQSLRLRQSGPAIFVDMVLQIPRLASFEEAHNIASEAEKAVRNILPNADTIVHIEPVAVDNKSIIETIRSIAARHGVGVHGIRVHHVRQDLHLEMHIEVPEHLTLEEAHEQATLMETALHTEISTSISVVTHIEPLGDNTATRLSEPVDATHIMREIHTICLETPDIMDCHNVVVLGDGVRPSVSFHCRMSPSTPIIQAHKVTMALEANIHVRLSGLDRIVVHLEPEPGDTVDTAIPC